MYKEHCISQVVIDILLYIKYEPENRMVVYFVIMYYKTEFIYIFKCLYTK